jgi:hypothetical protein
VVEVRVDRGVDPDAAEVSAWQPKRVGTRFALKRVGRPFEDDSGEVRYKELEFFVES